MIGGEPLYGNHDLEAEASIERLLKEVADRGIMQRLDHGGYEFTPHGADVTQSLDRGGD